jgi:hypothetical protein
MQTLQDPDQSNIDTLNKIRREFSSQFNDFET